MIFSIHSFVNFGEDILNIKSGYSISTFHLFFLIKICNDIVNFHLRHNQKQKYHCIDRMSLKYNMVNEFEYSLPYINNLWI